jgi:hypothetical protein
VLTVTATGIRRIFSFGDPGLLAVFGFSRTWPAPSDVTSAD